MKKRFFSIWLWLSLVIGGLAAQDVTPIPVTNLSAIPAPSNFVAGTFFDVAVFFDFLPQGRVGLVRVGGTDLKMVEASLFDRRLEFFTVGEDVGRYALIAVPLNQAMRVYELAITGTNQQGQTETLRVPVEVISGEFIRQDVNLVGDKAYLVDPVIEDSELVRLFELASPYTDDTYWNDLGFIPPINAELTSPFGAVRVFNGNFNTLHTGWDYQAALGRPLIATAGGKVVFAGSMAIRGNYVMIDHGRGIYSGYAHLSVIYVTQGQRVQVEQIIGQVGTTGRSSSPHAHFEMLVNDQWIDPADFLDMYLPTPPR